MWINGEKNLRTPEVCVLFILGGVAGAVCFEGESGLKWEGGWLSKINSENIYQSYCYCYSSDIQIPIVTHAI